MSIQRVKLSKISYKDSGVDIQTAEEIVCEMAKLRKQTVRKYKLLNGFGTHAAAFDFSDLPYQKPVIVTSCDGIGTKLELLIKFNLLETIGRDLVAMNVNDVICSGADPVLFMDYIATAKLKKNEIMSIISGMVEYLKQCDCNLAGGETAELPGLVSPNSLEISGFCLGLAEKAEMISLKNMKSKIAPGDKIIGFPANGLHANGFSLIRKITATHPKLFSEDEILQMLQATKLYYQDLKKIRAIKTNTDTGEKVKIKAATHITGGGINRGISRILGDFGAEIFLPNLQGFEFNLANIYEKVARHVDKEEMTRTFNMGIGFAVIMACDNTDFVLNANKETFLLGNVTKDKQIKFYTAISPFL